jgi:hypothetical protein
MCTAFSFFSGFLEGLALRKTISSLPPPKCEKWSTNPVMLSAFPLQAGLHEILRIWRFAMPRVPPVFFLSGSDGRGSSSIFHVL